MSIYFRFDVKEDYFEPESVVIYDHENITDVKIIHCTTISQISSLISVLMRTEMYLED